MRFKRILSFALVCFLLVGMMPVAQATDTNADSKTVQTAAVTDPADTIGAEPTEAPPEGLEDKFASSVNPGSEMNPGKDMSDMMAELEEGISAVIDADGQMFTGDYVPFQFNLKTRIEVEYDDAKGGHHIYHNQNLGCHYAGDTLTDPEQLIYCLEAYKLFSGSGYFYDDFAGVGDSGENSNAVWEYFSWNQQIAIGLVLLYGAPNSLWDTSAGLDNPKSVSNPNAGYRAATQIILWEFIAGLRNPITFEYANNGYTSPTIYYDNALGVSVGEDGTDYFKDGYDYIINCLKKHEVVPSFTDTMYSMAPTIQLTGKVTKVTDTNGVLSRCEFANTSDVKFDINGNVLTITMLGDTVPDKVYSTVKKVPSAEKSQYRLFWSGSADQRLIQVLAKAPNDPIPAYFKLKAAPGKLEIIKETNTGSTRGGWEISLYRDADCTDLVGTYITESNGKITTGDLEPGTYYAKETNCPASMTDNSKRFWVMDTEVKTVVVKTAETAKVTFTNNFCGFGNFVKTTNAGSGSLAGWIIGLYSDEACTEEIGRYTTDSQGKVSAGLLKPGTYYVKELGHVSFTETQMAFWDMDDAVKTLTIKSGSTSTVSFHNVIGGAGNFRKITSTGKNLGGWIIGLYSDEACTKEIGRYTTDANGLAPTGGLAVGTYYAKEIGHATMTDTQLALWEMDTNVKTVVIEMGKTTPVQFRNTLYGKGNFRKITNTGTKLDGWIIGLYSDEACTKEIGKYTTGADGYVATEKLTPGTYYAKELGHATMTATQLAFWDLDSEVKTVVIEVGNTTSVLFHNVAYGRIKVIKTTNTGKDLAGWVFDVKDEEENIVATLTTGEDGTATSGKIPAGAYVVTERSNENKYWVCDVTPKDVEVIAGETAEVTVKNEQLGDIKIIKTTNTGNNLAGWTISLYSDPECTSLIGSYITGEDGTITTELLEIGKVYAKETAAPAETDTSWWTMDASIKEVTVVAGQTAEVSFHNILKGCIKVVKTTNTGKTLSGWVFEIKTPYGAVVEVLTTGEDGTATSKALQPGSYVVIERAIGDKFWVCDVTPKNVEVIAGETAEVTVKNEQLGDIKITKTTNTGNNLAGWTISLYSDPECTSLIGSYITGEDGTITTELLEIGKVYAKETAAPNGLDADWWLMDTSIKEVTVVAGQTAEVSFFNILNGRITVKKETNTGKDLAGWVFQIKDSKGKVVETLTTGEDGTATSGFLKTGSYIVVEQASEDHFWVCDVTPKNVEVVAGETAEVTVKNEQLGDIKIIKTTNTGMNLGGWTIELYRDEACTDLVGSYVTKFDGTITTELLEEGVYFAKEVDTPYLNLDWWTLDTEVKTVEVIYGQTATVTFNNVQNGKIKVFKHTNTGKDLAGWVFDIKDAEGKIVETLTTGEDGTATSGFLVPAEYTVTERESEDPFWICDITPKEVTVQPGKTADLIVKNERMGSIDIKKTTNTGKDLDGWTIALYADYGCTELIGEYVTGENGTINTGALQAGTYYLREIAAPEKDSEWWTLDTSLKIVQVVAGQTAEVSFHNVMNGRITVTKETNTGNNLAGWIFQIKNSYGSIVETLTTGEDGTATSGFLAPGSYIVVEQASEDDFWICDVTPKNVEVIAGETAEIAVKNEQLGKLHLIKKLELAEDDTNGTLEGWQFKITRKSDNEEIGIFTTDKDGLFTTELLEPGDYLVEELIPEDSAYYCVSENPVTVTVTGGEIAEVTFTNALRPGKLVIYKINQGDEPLAGAKFLLEWSEDGEHWFPVELNEEVYTVKGGCSSEGLVKGCLVSGEDGIVTFDGLYPSVQYRVTELEAPNGYSLLADYAYVGVLPEATLLLELTVVNARTYLLPSTGSSGLVTVTSFGTVMILMAAAFLALVIWSHHGDNKKLFCFQRKNR